MIRRHTLPIVLGLLFAAGAFAANSSAVKVWETKITIPTYLAGDPEPNPMFFFGRQSQGAQGPVYPYPMYDTLTGKKVDKTYTAVYLENEYIRIGVLPEIGGRIFEGIDKTNNYNFIYRQHVIKPALIGLIGAWMSGGVEWNIPHHHRASTFIPVQYKTEENSDGSKTIWVGELELRQRMRWAVGYTLRPGKAVLEASVRIVNRTPEVNTMLCFANLAVHANDNYQVIFPPSTQFGVHHAKRQFTDWPISHSSYGGADFSKGVDISWYKNHQSANSVFAWNYQDDFFAGYDHGKEAGTMSVADHNIVPGKKFWTWGNGPSGKRWDATLTDDDGPYIELMVGAYSDNQPDYSWLQPYETRSFSMNWYPFRDIGGVKKANLDAAVNLDVNAGTARLGFYTTSVHAAARVMLKAGDKVLLQETVAINPAKPYTRQVALPAGIDEHDLVASLSDGRELVSYSPIRLTPQATPPVVVPPPAPQEVKTNEELYLVGLRAQQFHDPVIDPLLYWQEALRRDPGDSRVNTVLGITAFTKARYAEAEKYLRKALERLTDRYTDPKDAEALYYLGATLKFEDKNDEAFTWFYKATWSQAWKAASYYSLAQIATSRGDMTAALDFVNRSIESNGLNLRAQNLKAAVLRHLGRTGEARQVLAASHAADPLDVRAMAEDYLLSRDPATLKTLTTTMRAHPGTAQETAAEYRNEGLWQDGFDVLEQSPTHPMSCYYLGYFAEKLGRPEVAARYRRQAQSMSPDYVFPFQNEAIDVLRQAMRANPHDARAPYYLGNLLYDWQPEEATRMWEASAALDPSFAITHRNLATAYMHQASGAGLTKAIAELEKAVALPHKYALHFTELDELYEQAGTPIENRLPLFTQNASVVAQRDDALNRAVALQVAAGQIDPAIQTMTTHTFAVAEGANLNVVDHWTDAHVLRAQSEIGRKRYPDALADLEAAGTIPANLPVGSFGGANARGPEIAYWSGVAYAGGGDAGKAAESWKRAVAATASGAQTYYQGLAFQKLGQSEKAQPLFQALVQSGQDALKTPSTSTGGRGGRAGRALSPRLRSANAHYLAGLGYLGLNQPEQAKTELSQAVQISPDLLGARSALASLQSPVASSAPLKSGPPMPYRVATDWAKLPAGWAFGPCSTVTVDPRDHVWVFSRGAHPVTEFDRDGKMLRAWEGVSIKQAHGIRIDSEGNVWGVDVNGHVVRKYTPDGRVLMVVGTEGKAGDNDSRTSFNRPTNVAFAPNGDFYVSDGYVNSRVVHFSKDGKYLGQWGHKGAGDGEFDLVHDIVLDNQNRLLVGERTNQRIQIFDLDGKLLGKWTGIGSPWSLAYVAREDAVYMADGVNMRVVKLDRRGDVVGVLGEAGKGPGQFDGPHGVAVDSFGDIYVAEVGNQRVQKFVKR